MSTRARSAALAHARNESGAVLVLVAASLSVLILLVMFVVEVGNWFEHKRHLQTQVDAAAFAGAGKFQACFGGAGASVVFTEATTYAGAVGTFQGTDFGAPSWNAQVGGVNQGAVNVLYQSDHWANGTLDNDPPPAASPCSAPYVFDVKATEAGLPFFFPSFIPGLSSVAAINARARVQLYPMASGRPSMPLAIPNTNPQQVAVTFLDGKGNELSTCSGAATVPGTTCTFLMQPGATTGGLRIWSSDAPASVTVPKGKSGSVKVGIGGAVGSCAGTGGATYSCYVPGTDLTDPVQEVQLAPSADLSPGTHAFSSIAVGVLAAFTVVQPCTGSSGGDYSCPTDPTRLLRWASSSGSANYAFDCGTIDGNGKDLYNQIAGGCANTYSINPIGACPDASADPADCVVTANVGSGDKLGQIRSGMTDRFAPDGVCTANNYPAVAENDPRLAVLVVTSTSAFDGSSGAGIEVPVLSFAAFYITGWDGAPAGCDNEPYPGDPKDASHGDVWGHFVKYVDLSGDPDTSVGCDPTALRPCVPVLTK